MGEGQRKIRRYGWKPSLPDHRDLIADTTGLTPLPEVDPRPQMPAPYDQGQLGSCFPPGTLVRMADGSERPIEDVRLGELVVTAEGRTGMVHQTMLRLQTEGLIKVSLWGYSALRMTPEHPILTKRGYVAAGDLRLDDWVALTRYEAPARGEIDVASLVSKQERALKAGVRKMGVLHGRADVAVRVSALPDRIALTPRFGYLVGLFLAEGSTDSGKVRWTFGAHEEETLVATTVDLLTDIGVEGYVQHRGNNSINVVLYGTAWGRLWERLCGTGAGEKALNPALAGDAQFHQAVLEGWLAGDGYHGRKIGRSTRTVGTTVSRRLALGMYDIAQAIGKRPVLRRERAKVNSGAARRRDFYSVEMSAQTDNWRCEQTPTHVFRRVRAVEHVEFAGHVYNLSVEGDESYVAEGVGVHNCTANAVGAALEYDATLDGAPAVIPSRLFIYYCERQIEGSLGQGDTGAFGRDGFKAAKRYGTPPETEWPYDTSRYADDPPQSVWQDAATHTLQKPYKSVPRSVNQFKLVLSNRQTIAFGFSVYDTFESAEVAKTGIVPMPEPDEHQIGGHEVLAVGYLQDQPNYVLVRNSWGADWGLGGYFLMPWQYLLSTDLASDFRTIVRATT
jgi:Papain family cysteine protease